MDRPDDDFVSCAAERDRPDVELVIVCLEDACENCMCYHSPRKKNKDKDKDKG
jgi:hypothetical protein